jgi:UDP-N-acetyl-D-glucosamine dehydrogenase
LYKLNKNPNLNTLKNTFKNIKKYVHKKLIIVESSSYPGSTKELAKYFNKKLIVGRDFYLGYSPEREDPGNKKIIYSILPNW